MKNYNLHTLDEVRNNFERDGYVVISDTYNNIFDKIKYKCPNGHEYSISYANWLKGHRCPYCNGRTIYTIEIIKELFKKEGYILLSTEYINNKEKLNFVCNKGHNCSISLKKWLIGQRCALCKPEKSASAQAFSVDYVRQLIAESGEKLVSEYKNCREYIEIECKNKHTYKTRFADWKQGHRCPTCYAMDTRSKAEREVAYFLKKFFPIIKFNNRSLLKNKELDIYIPSRTTGVEYCGLYWHNELNVGKNYHLDKLIKCNKKGIKLITIFEDEWLHKQDIVEKMLLHKLGLNSNTKIFARNCEIVEVTTKIKDNFLNKYHIQGTDRSLIKLGALYKEQLIGIMTFNKPRTKSPEKTDIELSRFCTDYNYSVVGIAGKLLKYFIRNYPQYKNIISFADRRWSDGNLYEKLGFKFRHNTKPNYWYVIGNKRIHRFNFRKSELPKKLENFDPNLSEKENMNANGYNRIYDCGNSKFIYEVSK